MMGNPGWRIWEVIASLLGFNKEKIFQSIMEILGLCYNNFKLPL